METSVFTNNSDMKFDLNELVRVKNELDELRVDLLFKLLKPSFWVEHGRVLVIEDDFFMHPEDLMNYYKMHNRWDLALDMLSIILKDKIKNGYYGTTIIGNNHGGYVGSTVK